MRYDRDILGLWSWMLAYERHGRLPVHILLVHTGELIWRDIEATKPAWTLKNREDLTLQLLKS